MDKELFIKKLQELQEKKISCFVIRGSHGSPEFYYNAGHIEKIEDTECGIVIIFDGVFGKYTKEDKIGTKITISEKIISFEQKVDSVMFVLEGEENIFKILYIKEK